MSAADIIASCEAQFFAVGHDCNEFLKAVAGDAFNNQPFAGNADQIIAFLQDTANGWTDLNSDIGQAIASAKVGAFVAAGMTSAALGSSNGHVGIVAGLDGQLSGTVVVPLGYARSLADAALPQGQVGPNEAFKARLSGTFPAADVRAGNVLYFSKATEKF